MHFSDMHPGDHMGHGGLGDFGLGDDLDYQMEMAADILDGLDMDMDDLEGMDAAALLGLGEGMSEDEMETLMAVMGIEAMMSGLGDMEGMDLGMGGLLGGLDGMLGMGDEIAEMEAMFEDLDAMEDEFAQLELTFWVDFEAQWSSADWWEQDGNEWTNFD